MQDDGGTANGGVNLDPTERTITVNVTAVNDAPVAVNDTATTAEDTAVTVAVRANDFDVDSTTLTTILVAGPQHGSAVLNADGSFTYTPALNFNGADSFTYKVNDGALDSNVATVSITITAVNDAPVASDASLTTKNNATLLVDPRTFATDVDSTVLTTQIVTGPTHGTLAPNADGTYTYTPTAGFVGADSFRYTVSDGQLTSNQATVNISVTASNSAPVAVSSAITGTEDTPYVFAWADFHVTDADSTTLSIVVGSLPASGQLQFLNGTTWTAVTVGQTITQANISAGKLRFTPAANASGIDAYPTAGVGNLKKDYANFTYQGSDGALLSNVATMTIDISPVADAPTLTLGTTGNGASRELFRNSWETATNPNTGSTLVTTSPFEGWTLVTSPDSFAGGTNGFEIWTTGDQMKDSGGVNRTVSAKAGDGSSWLELNNASGTNSQTLGIQRTVQTQAGATYTLTFDQAGHLGFSSAFVPIGIYVDGTRLVLLSSTSPTTSLTWASVSFTFTGNGSVQTIKLQTDATSFNAAGAGAMIDNIALTEKTPVNTGYKDSAIKLSTITSALVDTDGSETLSLTMGAIPVGATLTDGTRSFTATATSTSTSLTGWTLNNLSITPPFGFSGTFNLSVTATSQETASTSTASTSKTLTVTVVNVAGVSPIVLDLNGDGVRTTPIDFSTGTFDLLNDGNPIASGWLSPEDGFLAIDTNGNGIIDDRSELFGGAVGEGFAKLAGFDSNRDGVVDASDARFAELKIWQDRNANHRTDAGELASLADFGIRSLSTGYVVAPELQNGNLLLERGTATLRDGRQIATADAYFEVAKQTVLPKPVVLEDRGASIIVRSEPSHPVLPLGPSPILVGGGANRPIERQDRARPVIDWTASSTSLFGDSEEGDAKKKDKGKGRGGWLAEFLGIGKAANQKDLAQQTGLKVTLNRTGNEL